MRLGWLSDIHLNFVAEDAVHEFLSGLSDYGADAWLVSGDIGQSESIEMFLRLFAGLVPSKMYFTLGNHDFYRCSLAGVREAVRRLVRKTPGLVWLTAASVQILGGGVAVVGDDSWADARFGNPHGTPVELNDFHLIADLAGLTRARLVDKLNQLGDEAAARAAPKLEAAACCSEHVVFVTHVPPFREAAWHRGLPSDDNWAPWFSCRVMGETLLQCARLHPTVQFLVLCGHTHGSGIYSPAKNVTVHTAEAEYGDPRVQRVFDI